VREKEKKKVQARFRKKETQHKTHNNKTERMRIRPIANDSAPVGELDAEHNSVTEAGEVATYEEKPGKERKKVVLNEPNYVVSVKAEFQGEFRRFPLKTLSFERLETKVRELYDLPAHLRISIFYFDGDNDRITLSSDQDLSFVAHELYSVPLIGDRDPCLKIQGLHVFSCVFVRETETGC
jgi:hypothetical protein